MASQASSSSDSAAIEERDIYEKLAKLQELSSQIFELRALLPNRLVLPTQAVVDRNRTIPPSKIAALLKDAAITGSMNIQKFNANYQSDDMKALWQQTNNGDFPQGDDIWTTNYASIVKTLAPGGDTSPVQKGDISDDAVSDEAGVLKRFQAAYPTISIESLHDNSPTPLRIIMGQDVFIVGLEGGDTTGNMAIDITDNASKTALTILQHIKKQHPTTNLATSLSLLASYEQAHRAVCRECGQIFDVELQLAWTRKQKNEETPKNEFAAWVPLHDSCA